MKRHRSTFNPDNPAPYELIAEPSISGEILFMSDRDGDWELYTVKADGTDLKQITNPTFKSENEINYDASKKQILENLGIPPI